MARKRVKITANIGGQRPAYRAHTITIDVDPDDLGWIVAGSVKESLFRELPVSVTKHPRWTEYVDEAEHGDGLEYWLNFKNAKAIETDFRLMVEAIEQ